MLSTNSSDARYRIAHIMPWTSVGGTEHATLRIAEAVKPAGLRSFVFHPEGGAEVRDFFREAGIETESYSVVEPSYRHPAAFLRASWRLARKLREERIDVVHCADVLAAHHTALAGRLADLPVICQVRNRHNEVSRRDRSFLFWVNEWVFVSRDTWDHFALKVPRSHGVVVYDGIETEQVDSGVDEAVRRELEIPADAPVIGMLARVAPQKDYLTLARAAREVLRSYPTARFLIVGDNAQTETHRNHYAEVQQTLSEMNIASRFIFTGFRRDTRRMIAAMNIFVLCTHHEGLPLVILEAMAQRRPVVATAVDGIPEIVLPGRTGLLHDHEDAAGLANHIVSLLRDEAYARRLGEAARTHVERDFSRERFAQNMTDLYYKVLNAAPSPAPREDRGVDNSLQQVEGN